MKYFVRTKEIEPIVASTKEAELINALPNDESIENRFPFNDIENHKVEVYKIGSQQECLDYINDMHKDIKYLFTVDIFP